METSVFSGRMNRLFRLSIETIDVIENVANVNLYLALRWLNRITATSIDLVLIAQQSVGKRSQCEIKVSTSFLS
jgi:hypothetical protein